MSGTHWPARLWMLLLCLAALVCYGGSVDNPFVFDDITAIVENPRLQEWSWTAPEVAAQTALAGRPLVAASFRLNRALGGFDPRGYRAVNLLIHVCCALLLFGLARRTLVSSAFDERLRRSALSLAGAASLLWVVHPLASEAVSYAVQRTESAMALAYLLTLYAAARGFAADDASGARRGWFLLAVVCCLAGVGIKESIVTCPLAVLLYDFAYHGRRRPWSTDRRWLYAGLALNWLALLLVMRLGPRSQSVGFDLGVSGWSWLKNQAPAVAGYFRQAAWPDRLLIDHGYPRELALGDVWIPALLLSATLLLAIAGFVRRPAVFFPLLLPFVVLAPTSTIVPIVTEVAAERRFYLPLAALCGLLTALLARLPVLHRRGSLSPTFFALVALLALALGRQTLQRNAEYGDRVALWSSAVEARPDNGRAQTGLGRALLDRGEPQAALVALERAIEIDGNDYHARFNQGKALRALGREAEAVDAWRRASALRPERAAPYYLRGMALLDLGRAEEAIAALGESARLDPAFAVGRIDHGMALARGGRADEALAETRAGLRLDPGLVAGHVNLGVLLFRRGEVDEAIAAFRRALELEPNHAQARHNLEMALRDDDPDDAVNP